MRTLIALLTCVLLASTPDSLWSQAPQIVPPPQSLKLAEGRMEITARSRIVVADPSLQPLANLLAEEIELLTGRKLSANNLAQPPAVGDIVLRINANLRADADILAAGKKGGPAAIAPCRDFAHTIEIGDFVTVEGWDYRAVCEGSATLLQLLDVREANVSVPRLSIKDWPHADYSGTMIDVARQRIPIDTLKAVVEACRLWKIRYCQLHLTDNEAFTFPSTAFPQLGSKNQAAHGGEVPRVYSLAELRDLVAYADARGVTLVPELSTPNHSEAMCRALPDVFAGPKILNLVDDKMYESLDVLVGEMCDVFRSSPYFHIGCEEIYFYELDEWPRTKEYLQKTGLKNVDEVFVQHVTRMNEMVRKRGKVTLAWENVAIPAEGRAYSLPEALRPQVVPMCWVPWPGAAGLQKQGFTTITVPWNRGDGLKNWNLYDCNGDRLDPTTSKVLGGAVTMWQMSAAAVVSDFQGGDLNGSSTEGYIRSLGNHVTGVWNPQAPVDAAAHDQALAASRQLLDRLLFPVRIAHGQIAYRGWPVTGNNCFGGQVEVRLSVDKPQTTGQIRYTLDDSEPTLQSPLYAAPLSLDKTTSVRAAYFQNGKQVGAVSRSRYVKLDDNGPIAKPQVAAPKEEIASAGAGAKLPPIVPTPKSIRLGTGSMALTAQSRIVLADPKLESHAAALQEELWLLTNLRLPVAKGESRPGDIVLAINPELRADEEILAPKEMKIVRTRDMAHTIVVSDRAVVEGWDFRAVCEGTSSLLQSLVAAGGKFTIPQMTIKDWPHADFSGTMVDCGRQWIPVDAVKGLVECCRYYKVRYIQLHVGDDQGYSMPSKAFPRLGTANGSCCEGVPPKVWKWEDLEDLEAFAAARGVAIIPELETPGHHQAMGRPYRDLFDGPGCMDMASEELYLGLDTVVGEMCSIFKSAPYFCIGCDEANNGTGAGPMAEIYKRRHAIPNDAQSVRNGHEIYVVHMKRMADICRKYGKLTIAYENFPNDSRIRHDIIPLIWYPHSVAHEYQQQGWTTITVPWSEEPDWSMYVCNGSRLARGDRVLGASSMMWQMSAVCIANGWAQNQRRSERTWGPDSKLDNADLARRMEANRPRTDRLAFPVKMETAGIDGGRVIRLQHFLTGRMIFGGKLQVTLSAKDLDGAEIRYTTDDSEPTPASTLYREPLVFDKTFLLNAAVYVGGKQIGAVTRAKYDWQDIEGYIEDWRISGPYTVAGKSGADLFDVPFAPEKGEAAKWIPFVPLREPPMVPWMVEFDRYEGFPGDARVAYLKCQVYSPQTQPALVFVGTDDGVKVFVNGKPVHGVNAGRGVTEEDRVGVTLQEGWNDLLIKVNNWTGGYAAKARVRSANDGRLEGLKIKAE